MKIKTTQHYQNEWTAIDEDTYDGPESSLGVGSTEDAAINDLTDQLNKKEYKRMSKIVMRGFPNNGFRIVSAREALELDLKDNLDDQVEVLAMLVQLLIDKGVLTLEDIAPMLGCRYTVED